MNVKSKDIEQAFRKNEQEAEAMSEQLAEIEAIYNSAPIGLCVLDSELRWVRLNKRFAELNGVSVEEHIGKTPSEVVPNIGKQAEEAMRKILETGEPLLNFEVSGITPAQPGVRRYWNENWLPLKDSQGNIIGVSITAEEISERRRMEDDLRKSEERYKELFRHAPVGIYEIDLSGNRFKNVNDVMCHYLGYTREELLTMNPLDLLDDQGRITFQERVSKGLPGLETEGSVEYKVKAKDGREYYAVLNTTFTYKDGKPEGATVIAHDITERKQAEEVVKRDQQQLEKIISERTRDLEEANLSLQQSEERFYKSFKSNPSLIGISTITDGRYIDVNDCFLSVLGYQREEVIGRAVKDLGIWASFEDREKLIRKYYESETIRDEEIRFHTKSGELLIGLASVEIIVLNNEQHLLVTVKDITKRKQAEEALRVSEERYRAMFEYSPDAVFQTVPDGTILDANPVACRMFGYSKEEMCAVGREGILDINDPRLKEGLEERKKTGKIFTQITSIRKDGTKFESEITSNIYKNQNGDIRSIVILRDITELKTYQNELARLDRLNLVGEMAAGIGHEVRNPMTTVKGYLQLFREKEEFANYFEQLELMVDEIDRANSIITEFLSLAKNKAVDLHIRSLNKIIKSIYPLIQADAMKRDNNIALELEDIPMLLLDEKEMRQVILNLVRNGLEAMQPGGNLTVRTFKEEGEVVLSVQDQGTGIKPEVLEKLGTPFFTTKDYGTGLGLAVCYSLAAKHNASIDIDTGPSGTTFYFRFKLKKQW